MSKFKVGQRVWSVCDGWGVVEHCSTYEHDNYPVYVKFDNKSEEQYTVDGKWNVEDLRPTLFLDEPKEWPDPPSPLPDIAIDTPMWCRWIEDTEWNPCHFAGLKDGMVTVFVCGLSSHTATQKLAFEPHEWSLTNPVSKETTDAH